MYVIRMYCTVHSTLTQQGEREENLLPAPLLSSPLLSSLPSPVSDRSAAVLYCRLGSQLLAASRD